MKTFFSTALVLPIVLIGVVASAQTTTSTSSQVTSADRERATSTIAERATAARTNIAQQRAALSDRAQERLINLAANISNRFDATITRMENIANRLDSRAQKIAATGQDTSAAVSALTAARSDIAIAARIMSTIDEEVLAVVGATDARAEWQSLRDTYQEVRALLQSARDNLQLSITFLRNPPAIESPVSEATTTTATSSELQ
jgi:hypothetical protein